MELLAPAGGLEQLRMAIHFGADSVYLAGRRWGMRAGAKNFSDADLAAAVDLAHKAGVAVHLTLNVMMRDEDLEDLPDHLSALDQMGLDALIVGDLGAMELARRFAPHVALHVSTQASAMNALAIDHYARLGARRVVLARELTLDQIARLRAKVSREVEFEVFAHGSLCMAYSGRCLLSSALMGTGRAASFGACAQPCRWSWTLVEDKDPTKPVPLEQDEHGSYLLSSNDLCMIEHLGDLRDAGVDAIKLEGRAKGSYYTACVTNAYRQVLDGASSEVWRRELDGVSHRPYSTGFFFGQPTQNPGRVEYARDRTMVGMVRDCKKMGQDAYRARVVCRNKALIGSQLYALSPHKPLRGFVLEGTDPAGGLVRNGQDYLVTLPFEVAADDLLISP